MSRIVDNLFSWVGFALVAVPVLLGPWLFGSWEMWHFWSLALIIFLSGIVLAVRLFMVGAAGLMEPDTFGDDAGGRRGWSAGLVVAVAFVPFLLYAYVRHLQADVRMDAERSFLLYLTPFLLALQIVFCFSRRQVRALAGMVLANILAIGVYGLVNHAVCGSEFVLWRPGYAQYVADNRATGPYFCPDHFAGILEIGLCLGLGFLLSRRVGVAWRSLSAVVVLVGLAGVVLSKSRGAGLSVVVASAAVLVWGFAQWPWAIRWYLRTAATAAMLLLLASFVFMAGGYMERFFRSSGHENMRGKTWSEIYDMAKETVRTSSRGRMIDAALRAWSRDTRSIILGIGPGMHQHVWRHYAPSPDGNRETGQWPTLINNDFHSYEVHSDWVQLLEEYGVVGLTLFVVAAGAAFGALLSGVRRETRMLRDNEWHSIRRDCHPFTLGALLAVVCIGFHSAGDFNLQMPATVWVLATVLAMALAFISRPELERPDE